MEFIYGWLALTALYLVMAHLGGIEWMKERDDSGPFGAAPVEVWKKIWRLIWILGTTAAAIGLYLL